ncbi:MAG: TldD/PmbA family protein [Chloroflexi bacterium]|nr:TldD/PmbA family protein [Chloroflexota bacterium]
MRNLIQDALKGHDADYLEIRVEEALSSHIRYSSVDLEDVGINTSLGGNVRALAGGGWGFACFNDLGDLRNRVSLAVRQARLVGGERIRLAPVEPVVDVVEPYIKKDPTAVPLAEKRALLDQYNQIMLGVPGVSSSSISYGDRSKKVYMATSEGTYLEQGTVDVVIRLSAIARDGSEVQQAGISLGSNGDFSFVENLHQEARESAEKAVKLLQAPRVKGGEYTVVLDPVLAGVFIHEAFGHLSEADQVYENNALKEIMVLGKTFGGPHLNVVDGAAMSGLRGSYKYDDEGVPATKTYLIKDGVLVGRLHSRETAAKMGEAPSGNARAISHQFPPIVRMTNTLIEAGHASFEDLISDIKEGVYARNWYGGMTSMEMFTFSAGEAYMIRNGRVEEMVQPVMLSGNHFTTLKNLDAVAKDLDINQGGGCGKGGQSPLPVSNGSPHIRIRGCLVGGA